MKAKDIRDQVVVARLLEHEMHVAGTIRVTLELLEELTDRSIVRDGVWHWHNGLEPEDTLIVTLHDSSAIRTIPFCILDIVKALAVCLPDINLDVVDWLSGSVFDGTQNKARLAIRIV